MTGPKREVLWGPKGRAGPCLGFLSKHTVRSINCIVPRHHPSTDQIQENTGAGGCVWVYLPKTYKVCLTDCNLPFLHDNRRNHFLQGLSFFMTVEDGPGSSTPLGGQVRTPLTLLGGGSRGRPRPLGMVVDVVFDSRGRYLGRSSAVLTLLQGSRSP